MTSRTTGPRPASHVGSSAEERQGLLSVNPRGFGFVSSLGDVGDDVFIPPDALGGAMHGDTVRIRVTRRSARGAEGEIVEIVERATKRVAGTLRRRGRSAWCEPDDSRIRGPIVLPRAIDQAGPEGNSGNDGDAIVITITRWPDSPDENPEGAIDRVLGRPGALAVEAAKILLLERVEEVHSDKAVAEAEAYGEEVPESMKEGREDLRDIPLPTIDPEDARDHDDAVWVERSGGGYRVWIAIADVSSYVTPGTALDAEAEARGCSIYLPDRAIPMLPRALSSNLCSLLPGVDRLCLCAIVDIDAGGHVRKSRVVRGVMRSRAKLTYGGVARALGLSSESKREPDGRSPASPEPGRNDGRSPASPEPGRNKDDDAEEMVDGLRVAYELSRILRAQRMKRGALDFDLPEAKVILHEDTREPVDVTRRAQDEGVKRAYQLIEELMLLANETVARWFQQMEVPTIYRVHAPPDEQKLERFAAMCEELGIQFDIEDTRDPKKLGELLKSFSDHPLAPVLNNLLLRSMKQATYDVANVGHFGLASKAYLHFTSPIRRYPDLVVHRQTHAVLTRARGQGAAAKEKLAEAALASSRAERRAMEVERSIVDLYRTFMMKDRLGERFEGTVTAVVGSGVFVQLDAPFVDVLVRLEDLGADRYEVDDEGLRVVAPRSGDIVALGDRMVVEVTDAAILRRTVYGRRVRGEGGRGREGKREQGREGPSVGRARVGDARGSKRATAKKGRSAEAEAKRKLARAGRKEKKLGGKGRKAKRGR